MYNSGAETYLDVGDMSAFNCLDVGRHCSSARFDFHWQYVQLSGKAHEDSDYTAMNAVMY